MIDIVVSRYHKDVTWVNTLDKVTDINIMIYEKESPDSSYNVPFNKGNEASVYLKHIIDNYDCLSEFTFFIHDEEFSWHHSGSIYDQFEKAIISKEMFYNINDCCIMGSIMNNPNYSHVLEWYASYIQEYVPIEILPNKDWTNNYRGSAQFLVHRERILNLPKKFYEALYDWILNTNMSNTLSGTFLEWSWHLIWEIFPNIKLNSVTIME
jgi:hypothetical protein